MAAAPALFALEDDCSGDRAVRAEQRWNADLTGAQVHAGMVDVAHRAGDKVAGGIASGHLSQHREDLAHRGNTVTHLIVRGWGNEARSPVAIAIGSGAVVQHQVDRLTVLISKSHIHHVPR